MGLFKKGTELLVLGAAAGIVIAGCGGGGGSGAAASGSSAVASYIADGQGSGLNGTWTVTGFLGQSATASTRTLSATGTAGAYTDARSARTLSSAGVWSSAPVAAMNWLDLVPAAGWVADTASETLVDNGDGVHATINNQNGATSPYSVTQSSLAGAPIVCLNNVGVTVTCAVPGNYPAGAAQYTFTRTADAYTLATAANKVTDATGTALTAMPAGTFCDPSELLVYVPGVTAGTYNAYWNLPGACTAANITAAIAAATPAGTVSFGTTKATGNSAVASVQMFSNWAGGLAGRNTLPYSVFLAMNGTNVYSGHMYPVGTQTAEKNKTAINAELQASGDPAIP